MNTVYSVTIFFTGEINDISVSQEIISAANHAANMFVDNVRGEVYYTVTSDFQSFDLRAIP